MAFFENLATTKKPYEVNQSFPTPAPLPVESPKTSFFQNIANVAKDAYGVAKSVVGAVGQMEVPAALDPTKSSQDVANETGNFFKNVLVQPFSRGVQSISLDYIDPTEQTTLTPNTPLEKFLFGTETIQPLVKQYTEAKQSLKSAGVPGASAIAATAIFGGSILDISSAGIGSEKNVVEALAKSQDVEFIAKTLRKIGVAEDFVKGYAPIIKDVNNPETVKSLLSNIEKLQGTTKVAKSAETVASKGLGEYKTINEGGVIKEVKGKSVKIIDGIETFIHEGDNPKRTVKGFIVSEKTTGRYIGSGDTEKEAIANAKNAINNAGEDNLKKIISENQLSNQAVKTSPEAQKGVSGAINEAVGTDAQKLIENVKGYQTYGGYGVGSESPNAYLRDISTQLKTPEGEQLAKQTFDNAISKGEIIPNEDGTITLYRVGEPSKMNELYSATYNKEFAQQFSDATKQSINEIKVNPEDIKYVVGGPEKEVLLAKDAGQEVKTVVKMAGNDGDKLGSKVVKQVFRSDKLNLDKEQTKAIEDRLVALNMTTRKVRTFADMQKAAQELGTDVQTLLKEAKNNRITDKEVIALRNLINNNSELIVKLQKELELNPKNATILANKIGMADAQINEALKKLVKGGTEAGRAVVSYRILAQKTMDPVFWLAKAQKVLGNKAVTPEIRAGILDLIAKKDAQGLASFISMLRTPSMAEKAVTLWKAGLLTSPTTHLANIGGNLTMSALSTAADVPSTGLDMLASVFTGKRTVTISPETITAKVKGLLSGTKEAGEYLKTGIYPASLTNKWDIPRNVTFKNKILDGYTQAIFRSLGAEDILFRKAALSESLSEQAIVMAKNEGLAGKLAKDRVRELLLNPTNEMITEAINASEYETFNNKNALGAIISGAKRSAGKASPLAETALEVIAPFSNTPSNIAARIADYSPYGFAKAIFRLFSKETRSQANFVKDLGRAITGTSVIGVGAWLGSKGLMTGNVPSSASARDQFYAEGKQANSILLGDHWYQLNRISPVGNLLAIGANFNELSINQSGPGLASSAVASSVKNLTDQTFLMGVSGAISAVNDPAAGGQKYIEQTASSVVPTVIGRLTKTIDPRLRLPDGIWQTIENKIPGVQKNIPLRRDIFGNSVVGASGKLALIDPFGVSSEVNNPVIEEAKHIGSFIGLPSQTISGIKLSNAEYSLYQKAQGKILEQTMNKLITSPDYLKLTNDKRGDMFDKTVTSVRTQVNSVIFPALMIKRYGLSKDTNPEILRALLSELSSNEKFKKMPESKQGIVIKKLLKQ